MLLYVIDLKASVLETNINFCLFLLKFRYVNKFIDFEKIYKENIYYFLL